MFLHRLIHAGLCAGLATLVVSLPAPAATLYVWTNSPSDGPGTNWATAYHTLQSGVDAASAGDTVMATNGVYSTGTQVTPGFSLLNRVVITKNIVVKSVNGPASTWIVGQGPLGTNSVRCVFITNGVLSGFTLSNGYTRTSGNWAYDESGGGAFASGGTISNCVVAANVASVAGGGAEGGTIFKSTIIANTAPDGGGVDGVILYNCAIVSNTATSGGGAWGGLLINCTVTANSASDGGGAFNSTLTNCIVYYNTASTYSNLSGCSATYCCTTPAESGQGNITTAPGMVSLWHIALTAPCVGAGTLSASRGTDIDGEVWKNAPSMGCDEPTVGALTGSLSVAISPQTSTVATETPNEFIAHIVGACTSNVWSYGDGATGTNGTRASHAWTASGDYTVVIKAFNESYTGGVAATAMVQVVSAQGSTRYVWTNSPTPSPPYTIWANAAHTIQEAVNVCTNGDVVLVTNGTYSTGSNVTPGYVLLNRVVITNNITVKSVNGPASTIIVGQGPTGSNYAMRCVFITNGLLEGFWLMNGHTRTNGTWNYDQSGGCVWGGTLSNCIISAGDGNFGGGAYSSRLYNCTLTANSAGKGGGANISMLYNCSVSSNFSGYGGGVFSGMLYNCILTANNASYGGGAYYSTLYNSALSSNGGNGHGAGAYGGALYNCTLTANSGSLGGGAKGSLLSNCILTANSGYGAYEGTLYDCALTTNDGGAYGGTLYNCMLVGNNGNGARLSTLYNCTLAGNGGGASDSVLYNSIVCSNSVSSVGGGVSYSTLYNCALSANFASNGGGAIWSTLYNSTVIGNSASIGGGVSASTLHNCTIAGNSASNGGGGYSGTYFNCTIVYNTASDSGGGIWNGTLENCVLATNSANNYGGGARGGTLHNCTLITNSAYIGGGAWGSGLTNCIVYYNAAHTSNNLYGSPVAYSCALPPQTGQGNITNEPAFQNWPAGDYHLTSGSPCVDAGVTMPGVVTNDLDGIGRPLDGNHDASAVTDMGAYEYVSPFADTDSDGDGVSDIDEFIAGSSGADGSSLFSFATSPSNNSGIAISFPSLTNRLYRLQSKTNLLSGTWVDLPVWTNIVGSNGITTISDTNTTDHKFYRVKVRLP